MEDYEYKVMKLHATLFQNSSKSTGNIRKNTSKFTSKTNQLRLVGGHGGAYPLYASLSQTVCRPEEPRVFHEDWVCGETTYETYETSETSGGK